MGELEKAQLAQLPRGVAEHRARALIDAQDRAAQRGVHDAHRRLFEGLAEQLLALHRVLQDAVGFRGELLGGKKFLEDLGELGEHHELEVAELPDLRIERAQRPDRLAISAVQRNSHIGAQVPRPAHQQTVRKARVQGGIEDHERLALQHDLAAKPGMARGLAHVEADPRLEPDTMFVDQRDQQQRHPKGGCRQARDGVEGFGRRGVEQSQSVQARQALRLIGGHAFIVHRNNRVPATRSQLSWPAG